MRSVRLEIISDNDRPVDAEISIESETGSPGSGNFKVEESYAVTSGTPDARRTINLIEGQRLVIAPRGKEEVYVYDKDQNAHVRVESEEEVTARKEREANAVKSAADQAVRSAQARVGEAQDSAKNAERDANAEVKKAEADAAKLKAEQAKNQAAASEQIPAGSTTSSMQQNPGPTTNQPPSKPASANTGPVDSKQVKAEAPATVPSSRR